MLVVSQCECIFRVNISFSVSKILRLSMVRVSRVFPQQENEKFIRKYLIISFVVLPFCCFSLSLSPFQCAEGSLSWPELRISCTLLALSRSGYTLKVKHGHVVAIVATKEEHSKSGDRRREAEVGKKEGKREESGLSGICRFRMSEFHVIFVEFA